MTYRYILLLIFSIYTLNAGKSIEIDLTKQKIYAKNNGNIIFSGWVSTGKYKHRTPRGNFRILDKERFHISNKYPEPHGGAKMPYMLRITNAGVAIHQGYLPGYPASHGCIRVSKNTAKKLWYWAKIGTKVKIYGDPSKFKYVRKSKKRGYFKHKKYHAVKKRVSKRKYAKARRQEDYEVIEVYDSY
jgi:hypothetical protein